jgi:hypothetical protein
MKSGASGTHPSDSSEEGSHQAPSLLLRNTLSLASAPTKHPLSCFSTKHPLSCFEQGQHLHYTLSTPTVNTHTLAQHFGFRRWRLRLVHNGLCRLVLVPI